MINFIKKILGMEHEIHNGFALSALSSFPYGSDVTSGSYLYDIVSVRATRKGKKITVYIETHRPGILIGRKGILIGALREYINHRPPVAGCTVDFHLVESRMFFSENW